MVAGGGSGVNFGCAFVIFKQTIAANACQFDGFAVFAGDFFIHLAKTAFTVGAFPAEHDGNNPALPRFKLHRFAAPFAFVMA